MILFLNYFDTANKGSHIDKLLGEFKDLGWDVPESIGYKYFSDDKVLAHQFRWPEISFSDDRRVIIDPILDGNKMELFGVYRIENENKEGRIIIYHNAIEAAASEFIEVTEASTIQSREQVIKNLTKIVLIHEFVHWIMHWIKDPNGFRFIPFRYKEEDEIYFHEQFAQLLTYRIIQDDADLVEIFKKLEEKQPLQYKIIDKEEYEGRNIKDVIKVLEFTRLFCGYAAEHRFGQSYPLMKACFIKEICNNEDGNRLRNFKRYIPFVLSNQIQQKIDQYPEKENAACIILAFLKLYVSIKVKETDFDDFDKTDVCAIKIWHLNQNKVDINSMADWTNFTTRHIGQITGCKYGN